MLTFATPGQASFSAEFPAPLAVSFNSPASFMRPDYPRKAIRVNVGWQGDLNFFQYARSFYRLTGKKTTPFICPLILNEIDTSLVTNFIVQWVPGSWKLVSLIGATAKISASVEAQALT